PGAPFTLPDPLDPPLIALFLHSTRPEVTLNAPPGGAHLNGCASIDYSVKNTIGHPVNIAVDYATDGDGYTAYHHASQAGDDIAPGTFGLTPSPTGVRFGYLWDTSRDLPQGANVKLRLRASVPGSSEPPGELISDPIVVVADNQGRSCNPAPLRAPVDTFFGE